MSQLPPDVNLFTGRDDILRTTRNLLEPLSDHATTVVVPTIAGQAGMARTALAIEWPTDCGHPLTPRPASRASAVPTVSA